MARTPRTPRLIRTIALTCALTLFSGISGFSAFGQERCPEVRARCQDAIETWKAVAQDETNKLETCLAKLQAHTPTVAANLANTPLPEPVETSNALEYGIGGLLLGLATGLLLAIVAQ